MLDQLNVTIPQFYWVPPCDRLGVEVAPINAGNYLFNKDITRCYLSAIYP